MATIGGLIFSADQARQSRNLARQSQTAQASERFSRSVEQLGSKNIAVRIGAVYAFDRLMDDSLNDKDSIGQILNTFIRIQAVAAPPVPAGYMVRETPPDALAALMVLDHQAIPLQLNGISLPRLNLSNMTMSRADLTRANLSGTDLTGTELFGARLINVDLNKANLTEAILANANLFGAQLNHAFLLGANFNNATLVMAHMIDVEAAGVDLTGADLTGADLTGANLTGANLTGADLRIADLSGADLSGADLNDAVLIGANFARVTCSAKTHWPDQMKRHPRC